MSWVIDGRDAQNCILFCVGVHQQLVITQINFALRYMGYKGTLWKASAAWLPVCTAGMLAAGLMTYQGDVMKLKPYLTPPPDLELIDMGLDDSASVDAGNSSEAQFFPDDERAQGPLACEIRARRANQASQQHVPGPSVAPYRDEEVSWAIDEDDVRTAVFTVGMMSTTNKMP